jgi:hypothetical protein
VSSLVSINAESRPVSGGVAAVGTVIRVHAVNTGRGWVYAPVVEFTDTGGQRIVSVPPTSSTFPQVGSTARVSYSPTDPTGAHDLSNSAGAWAWPFYTGVFILLLALVWYLFLAWAIRRNRARRRIGYQQITET